MKSREGLFEFARKLPEGEHKIPGVPFFSQLLNEKNFESEGFKTLTEAKQWTEKICGLACVKMAIRTFYPESGVLLKDLLDEGLEHNAYKDDVGWIHQGLVDIGKRHGLLGGRESVGKNIEKIGKHICTGRIVIPSVTVGFEAGEMYVDISGTERVMERGGHLVVVFGVEVKNGMVETLTLHHPSSSPEYEWANHAVQCKKFAGSFSERGNIIYFGKK